MRAFRREVFAALAFWLLAGFFYPAARAASVYPGHPRLFFRAESWDGGRGLTLAEVKRRAAGSDASVAFEQLDGSIPNDALRSLLLEDSDSSAFYARRAIEAMLSARDTSGVTTQGVNLANVAIGFDWLYGRLDFTEEEKARVVEHLAREADELVRALGGGSHIFHTRMYGWATGVALAGLALYGHHPQAQRFVDFARSYYLERLFPARRLQDGTVHNGFGYGRKYTLWMIGHFISCWQSATGENLWDVIEREQGGWLRREILFNIYGRYPDGTYLRLGDSYSLTSDFYTFRAVSERVQGHGDPVGQSFLNQLVADNSGRVVEKPTAYVYFLFYDPGRDSTPVSSLPHRILFSREGTGMAVWKSDWEENGVTVFFKCGNYFDDHGHFDQGHLDVFHRAPLLIDSGAYLTFEGPFRTEYWHRSVAHNTILIVDPALPGDEGGQRVFSSQSDGTLEKYLANKRSETGDIKDYLDEAELAYVAGDLTAAYPADRAERVTREVAFLSDRFLVVLDRVTVKRAGLEPKVLWHCPVYPQASADGRRFVIDRSGGRAIVTTLLPEPASVAWVEGFMVGSRKIEPTGVFQAPEGMGVGRFEVSDPQKTMSHLFLHVIEIADTPANSNAYEAPPARVAVALRGDVIEVQMGNQTISFRAEKPGLVR